MSIVTVGGGGRGGLRGAKGVIAAGADLVRGAGANIPDGGTGWSRLFELDVTQPDQTALQTSLGSILTGTDPGGLWGTPNGSGTGCYWDETLDGRRCVRMRWGTDQQTAGAFQNVAVSQASPEYFACYVRMLVAFSANQDWASSTVKLVTVDDGNWVVNATGLTPPRTWWLGNIHIDGGGVTYKTQSTYGASSDLVFTEVEFECQIESAEDVFDGEFDMWIDGTRVTDWNNGGGTRPTNIVYAHSTDPTGYGGVRSLKHLVPFLGGSPAEPITTPFDIYFACQSWWVKEEGAAS